MEIEKSAEALKKEKKIAELERQIKRTQTTLKSLKTRLNNNQTRIEEIQREVFNKTEEIRARWITLNQDIEQLVNKLFDDRRINDLDKSIIEELYEGLVKDQQVEMPPIDMPDSEYSETEEKARFREMFSSFRVEPNPTDQQEIRKVYLRLSKKFHPDKANKEQEIEQYHHLQQKINAAYKAHDIQELLDLEALFDEPELNLKEESTIDSLDSQIIALEHQLKMLKNQQKRLSKEIKQLRNSEMGNMLTMVNGMERYGASLDEGLGLPMMEDMLGILDRLKLALEETDKSGRVSPELHKIKGEIMEAFSPFDLDDEIFDDEDLSGDFWDNGISNFAPNPRPKFPVGTAVCIRRSMEIYSFDDKTDAEYTFDGKGLSGVISEALLDEEGVPFYYLTLDIASMKRMPADYVRLRTDLFNQLEIEDENDLATIKPNKQEDPKKTYAAFRKILYSHLFSSLPKDQQKRLENILLAFPGETDEANWLAYFEDNLPLPFPAKSKDFSQHIKPGQKVEVLQYGGYSEEFYLMVIVQTGRGGANILPLYELKGIKSGPVAQLLEDYSEWYEVML
ncbi:coiled-coil domain-containing protein [Flavilitoribacter nigricans]|uniref:J domain-containing protein n=1 Tax=Flavilitoribacter nigricans (strain ATCC 23147 / DSM 23189 / NBRC 102662 / NCIMB 1420 / SS-2) TaxID=1122177 RepID=A0A2D0N4X3_FLAN2|nr:DnaJ domain-containing protein [Flavilitoribacter nigricans]PHN02833.1 hypothetical protein CRP01_30090 [Flavilitoribacter nigricans DSM 23189 = NBRC 102662]